MELAFIERLIEAFGRSPATELKLAKGAWRIRLSKAEPAPATADLPPPLISAAARDADRATSAAQPDKPQLVVAGLVGTFYRAPGPGNPPFVSVGDLVEDGQALGLLEAMKTLIKVEAECAGTITEILAQDGASVETGEPLFAIRPAARA